MPWVSRPVWDALLSAHREEVIARKSALGIQQQEIEFLRAALEKAQEHGRRMDRVDRKLPETAPVPKKREPMPEKLLEYILAWDTDETRKTLAKEAEDAYDRTGSWDQALKAFEAGGV